MKKTLLFSAILSLAVSAQAAEPTLLKVFEYELNGEPASSDARFGTGYNGSVLTQSRANKQIIAWNATGKSVYAENNAFNGTAITRDEVGNLLVGSGFSAVTSSTNWSIVDSEKNVIPVTFSGFTAARLDQVGRVVGNMLSETGAYVYLTPNTFGNVIAVKIYKSGEEVKAEGVESKALGVSCNTSYVAQPSVESIGEANANTFYWRNRSDQKICYFNDNSVANFTTPSEANGSTIRSCEGFDVFTLDGITYAIQPFDKVNYGAGFVICKTDGTIVATRTSDFVPGGQRFQSLVAEKIDEKTANIYQYVSGGIAAMFVFTTDDNVITGVEETLIDANAPVEYYNLQGVKVANPEKGLFIKKQGNKATKVVL